MFRKGQYNGEEKERHRKDGAGNGNSHHRAHNGIKVRPLKKIPFSSSSSSSKSCPLSPTTLQCSPPEIIPPCLIQQSLLWQRPSRILLMYTVAPFIPMGELYLWLPPVVPMGLMPGSCNSSIHTMTLPHQWNPNERRMQYPEEAIPGYKATADRPSGSTARSSGTNHITRLGKALATMESTWVQGHNSFKREHSTYFVDPAVTTALLLCKTILSYLWVGKTLD